MRAAPHAAAAACPRAAAAPPRHTHCRAATAAAAAARRRAALPQLPPRCTPRRAALTALAAAATRARRGAACGPRGATSTSSALSVAESQPPAAAPLTPLDAFLSAHGAAALLGYAVVQHADGYLVGHVAEVLAVSGGEVVMGVTGAPASADADGGDALADMLAGLPALAEDEEPAAPAAPESLLLRVEGAGCVRGRLRKSSHYARASLLLLTCVARAAAPLCPLRRRAYEWECFVPLVAALVPGVEVAARRLRIAPPRGLVESGELPHLLAWLRQQLAPYLTRYKSGALGARCAVPLCRHVAPPRCSSTCTRVSCAHALRRCCVLSNAPSQAAAPSRAPRAAPRRPRRPGGRHRARGRLRRSGGAAAAARRAQTPRLLGRPRHSRDVRAHAPAPPSFARIQHARACAPMHPWPERSLRLRNAPRQGASRVCVESLE
jgi:hypothetical protein